MQSHLLQIYRTELGQHLLFFLESLCRGRGFKSRGRGGRTSRGGSRGGRGIMKGFGPHGHGRGRMKDGAMNGLAPIRYFLYLNTVCC